MSLNWLIILKLLHTIYIWNWILSWNAFLPLVALKIVIIYRRIWFWVMCFSQEMFFLFPLLWDAVWFEKTFLAVKHARSRQVRCHFRKAGFCATGVLEHAIFQSKMIQPMENCWFRFYFAVTWWSKVEMRVSKRGLMSSISFLSVLSFILTFVFWLYCSLIYSLPMQILTEEWFVWN